jgi:excisionase family DNA binding protein
MIDAPSARRLFLSPQPTYSPAEAAEVLGLSHRDLVEWVEAGELEPTDVPNGRSVFEWEEVVRFAFDMWQEVVEEALGEEVAGVVPELLRLTEFEVRVRRVEVVALERVAARDGKSVSQVVSAELMDLVSAESEWLSAEVIGFAEALRWPGREV